MFGQLSHNQAEISRLLCHGRQRIWYIKSTSLVQQTSISGDNMVDGPSDFYPGSYTTANKGSEFGGQIVYTTY